MRSFITISGNKTNSALTREIRIVMQGIGTRLWRYLLDARFLLLQLAGMSMAQRVAVPVGDRRQAVGVTRRPSARMADHSHRMAGRLGGPWSGPVDGRF